MIDDPFNVIMDKFAQSWDAIRREQENQRLRELLRRCWEYIGDLAEWNDATGTELLEDLEEFKGGGE